MAVETFIRRGAERFIEEVRGDDPELGSYLRIGERELEAGGRKPENVTFSGLGERERDRLGVLRPIRELDSGFERQAGEAREELA